MRYRVRRGSIADYVRIGALAIGFWSVLIWAMVTSYPV